MVVLAIDAFLNSESPRYSGKGMRIRALGYAGGLLAVPFGGGWPGDRSRTRASSTWP